MFVNIATYGYEWFTMDKDKKDIIKETQTNIKDDSMLYKAGESDAQYKILEQQAQTKGASQEIRDTYETVKAYKNSKEAREEGKTIEMLLAERKFDKVQTPASEVRAMTFAMSPNATLDKRGGQ